MNNIKDKDKDKKLKPLEKTKEFIIVQEKSIKESFHAYGSYRIKGMKTPMMKTFYT